MSIEPGDRDLPLVARYAYLFTIVNWAPMLKIDLSPWPAVVQFQQRVASRPAVQKTLKAEGLI